MARARLLDTTREASPEGVQAVVDATELVDLRVDEISAGPLVTTVDDLAFRLGRGAPEYQLVDNGLLMVRVQHILECLPTKLGELIQDGPITSLKVAHVLTFAVADDVAFENADLSAWIQTNIYFIVYPYVRQIFTTLTASMGLPPVVLGYMKRDDWPDFEDVEVADTREEGNEDTAVWDQD